MTTDRRPALIGLAHGSRHPAVVGALRGLLDAVALPQVVAHPAFLDLTEPDLTTVAQRLAADGATEAVVVPLLFTSAYHATVDVPEAIAAASEASGLTLHCGAILGTGSDVLEVLLAHLQAAGIADDRPVLLFAVGSSDPAANAAVAALAADLSDQRSAPAAAGFGTVAPRAEVVLATLPGEPVVLPLFVSPGLLLDAVARSAAGSTATVLEPLGVRLAPLVAARYQDAEATSNASIRSADSRVVSGSG